MKVKALVTFDREIEVDIGLEEILAAVTEWTAGNDPHTWLDALHHFALCLHALPEDVIAHWHPQTRERIARFFAQQLPRFAEHGKEAPSHV